MQRMIPAHRRWLAWLLISSVPACDSKLVVGKWTCSESAGVMPSDAGLVELPWSTGFEDRFCDYAQPAGFCYSDAQASYKIVSSPVHTGRYAAAFHINSDEQTEIFALVELDDLSVPEAAEALDIALNTAYSRLRMARQAFDAALARHEARSKGR